jgi:hypothetical protein
MLPQSDTRFAAFYGPALAQRPKTRTACRRGSSTSSKVWRCDKTLGRGGLIVHQWARGAKTVGERSGARLAVNFGARHGLDTIAGRAAAGHRRSRLAPPEGKMTENIFWRSRDTSKWSRPLPAGHSPTASFDSKRSRVAGFEGQLLQRPTNGFV